MWKESRIQIGILVAAFIVLPGFAMAAEINVIYTPDTNCTDDGKCDFQTALSFAAENDEADTLYLTTTSALPGDVYETPEPLVYASDKGYGLTIEGIIPNNHETVLSGGGLTQVLNLDIAPNVLVDVVLRNFTIVNGYADPSGGGLYINANNANVTIENVSFDNNIASSQGGGAWIVGANGTATVTHCSFNRNSASEGAGLYLRYGTISLASNTFSKNEVGGGQCRGGGASVYGDTDTVSLTGNWFQHNESRPGDEGCRGGGLHLALNGFADVVVKSNNFRENQLGQNGMGAGAYINRVDGPIAVESNRFLENRVGGVSLVAPTGGAGGLWLSLWGSFAQGSVLNNAFVGNASPLFGKAAWISSLDTAVLFASNTVVFSQLLGSRPDSNALHIEAPVANIYNNVFWNNDIPGSPHYDLYVVDQEYQQEQVDFQYNHLLSYSIPPDATGTQANNTTGPPFLTEYPDFHIASRRSPLVDSASPYAGSPQEDIDGEDRTIDGDGNESVVMDKGADELSTAAIALVPSSHVFLAEENYEGRLITTSQVFSLVNASDEPLTLNATFLGGSEEPGDWYKLDYNLGGSVQPGEEKLVARGIYVPLSGRDSNNTLVVETSVGTFTAELIGNVELAFQGDNDGLSDLVESGPRVTRTVLDYDGNCDDIPDRQQDNVASFWTRTAHYVTVVAPMHGQQIGTGPTYEEDEIPVLMDVRAIEASDVGSGPMIDSSYPYGFIGFRLTTQKALAGAFGGTMPLSIILPEGAALVNSYAKYGPTPDDDWINKAQRPEGGVGEYEFLAGISSHFDLYTESVGAKVEVVSDRKYPVWNEEAQKWDCELGGARRVVHLVLVDGKLGDSDLTENGFVVDPGGPAIVEVVDGDSDGIADRLDNCPRTSNPGQEDGDSDGIGDACECPRPCGNPVGATEDVTATDALHALQASVGVLTCPVCVCDADDSGSVVASDALRVLRYAVGLPVSLDCPLRNE